MLQELEISSFKEITKDNFLSFLSIAEKMPPELLEKAVKDIPEFRNLVSENVKNFKDLAEKVLEGNSEDDTKFYLAINRIIDILDNELQKEVLTPEERKYIISVLKELPEKIENHDIRDKEFLKDIQSDNTAFHKEVVKGVLAIVAATVGLIVYKKKDKDKS